MCPLLQAFKPGLSHFHQEREVVLYKLLYELCPRCLVNPILCGTCAVVLATSVLHMGRQPIWSHVASSGLVSIKDMQGFLCTDLYKNKAGCWRRQQRCEGHRPHSGDH